MRDTIHLKQINCYGYCGVFAEERALGQRFVIDIDVQINLEPAGHSDALHDTLDYGELIKMVQGVVAGEQFFLLEAMAHTLAVRLRSDPRVERVRVEVHKPQPPIPNFGGSVSIEIWR
ncbi:MAG: dihydroneopterin aldolase [Gemmatimonadaceae bacterium]|nr:dihydroneopterin aldolase [Gloeobacterales cyanobacterium ES-bin-141]